MNKMPINVYSEIGKLKKVLLHRPGKELENLMPEYLDRLLFDDIPYLKIAQEEHDAFAQIFRENGIQVVYLEDLVVESLINDEVKSKFIDEYIEEAGIRENRETGILKEYFLSFSDNKEMVLKMMEGIRKSEIKDYRGPGLADYLSNQYPFIIDPMPNLYFTRDPFAAIGNGVSIHKMFTVTRNRETLFGKYIFNYNPLYKGTKLFYDRTEDYSLEGGDILVLNKETIAVGISQRTNPNAIEKFAISVLAEENSFKKVLAIDIPKTRAFMHLDTVFTMVDYDKFTIHPNIRSEILVYILRKVDGKLNITEERGSLEDVLQKELNIDKVKLIKCGGDSVIDASREQWNDGSNTLCISPGQVIVYSRNYVTNEILESEGIKTHVMPSSELSRGRGGPRCMSMPLIREDI
ncbi:MAG TPA: arginine deiminase [Sedimentibacter sp.]|jgi:arginine deiminase|nr:arginine deiminase [Sedimentibacter sp.]HHZ00937.1 arginine deiminase [Tissierellia bacterium]HOK50048.1 arginine deiminase [Sedimentibacter sp.]HOW24022.1 arginine deiminase [Sedimentibacter sp.]HRC82119.1 arginine deiminase [Sedimentibacter sp.]